MAKDLALLIDSSNRYDIRKIVVTAVEIVDDAPHSLDDEDPLDAFTITAYVADPGRDSELYGFDCRYEPHTVNLRRARNMASVLGKIERGLEKMANEDGYVDADPDGLATYIMRVAKIVGVKKFVVRTSARGSYYRDSTWEIYGRAHGRIENAIRRQLRELGVTEATA